MGRESRDRHHPFEMKRKTRSFFPPLDPSSPFPPFSRFKNSATHFRLPLLLGTEFQLRAEDRGHRDASKKFRESRTAAAATRRGPLSTALRPDPFCILCPFLASFARIYTFLLPADDAERRSAAAARSLHPPPSLYKVVPSDAAKIKYSFSFPLFFFGKRRITNWKCSLLLSARPSAKM